jgi:hypothetical protein
MLKTINIKEDMPSVEDARKRLLQEINQARKTGVKALKVIHGYGSTGKGGALRDALRKSLLRRKKEGVISNYVYGEKWSIFEPDVRAILEICPQLRSDPDLDRCNEGMTIVFVQK